MARQDEFAVQVVDGTGDLSDYCLVVLSRGDKRENLHVEAATAAGRERARLYRSGVADGIYYARHSARFADEGTV